jgi:hypothetical protein
MMIKNLSFFLAFLSLGIVAGAQSYNGPESIEYDAANDRWMVANSGNGEIIARANDGTLTVFASGLATGPYGMEIVGNTIYACDGGRIKGYDLTTGAQVTNVNLGGTFLNGITHVGTDLFITDFSVKEVIRFNTLNNSFNDFVTGLSRTPNGIIYDDINNRLVMVNWGTNAPIIGINLTDSTYSTLATTTLGNCDGIAMNCSGQFYVASWSPSRISRFDNDFVAAPVNMNVTGLSSAADIFYNQVEDTLGIPNSGNNTVKFVQYNDCLSLGVEESNSVSFQLFPNPANEMIFIQAENENSQMVIADQTGRIIVNEKMISSSYSFDVSLFSSGIYFVTIDNFTQKLFIQR